MIQGVQIDMISEDMISNMTSYEKIRLILDDVRHGSVVVLEKGLSAEEQGNLLEATMMEITPGGFSGIEIETYPAGKEKASEFPFRCSLTTHVLLPTHFLIFLCEEDWP